MALLDSANSGPSPADLEAQRQAEFNRQARLRAAQEAEAARKRKFDAEKQEAIADMKGGAEDAAAVQADDFDLKGDDSNDLKDAPHDLPGEKNFPHPHLKAAPGGWPWQICSHRPSAWNSDRGSSTCPWEWPACPGTRTTWPWVSET